jgi:drug/metabolite transporter (DMT)-like permease
MTGRPGALYVALLLAVTAVWGWTFVVVKDAIAELPPLPFLGLRFLIAAAVMLVVVRRLPGNRTLAIGALIGLPLAVGYLLQTLGLRLTSPGNAGLITGLFFVFTPLLDRLFGVPMRLRTLLAVAVAAPSFSREGARSESGWGMPWSSAARSASRSRSCCSPAGAEASPPTS